MKRKVLLTAVITALAVMLGQGEASALNRFKNLETYLSDDSFQLVLSFEKAPRARMSLLGKAVQVEVANAFVDPAKRRFKINRAGISEVLVYQFDKKTLRIRILPSGSIEPISKGISLKTNKNRLLVNLPGGIPAKKSMSSPVLTPEPVPRMKSSNSTSPMKLAQTADTQNAHGKNETELDALKSAGNAETNVENRLATSFATAGKSNTPGFLEYSEPKALELPSLGGALVNVGSALMIVLALVLVVAFFARKYLNVIEGRSGARKEVKVLANHFIGVKKNITLVEIAGEILVLGVTNNSINLLARYSDPEKIERIKLSSRLPSEPKGLIKKIPGLNWGIGAKRKLSRKFANQVETYKKAMDEKAKVKAAETRKRQVNNITGDIAARYKAMQGATAAK